MAVLSQIMQRYSVRAYRDRPVEPGKLNNVLEAARHAPSARNMQDWRSVCFHHGIHGKNGELRVER